MVLASGGVLYYGWQREHTARVTAQQATLAAKQVLSVRGLIGPKKADFFKEPQVQTILKDKYQLIIDIESAGSRRIASWQPVTQVLENNGIVKKSSQHYRIIDMLRLLDLLQNQTRWQDLPHNDSFGVGRKVLIKSTNIASSNVAAMYLSLTSYLANNNDIVTTSAQINAVIPKIALLFTTQGYMVDSSATLFEDYLTKGMSD